MLSRNQFLADDLALELRLLGCQRLLQQLLLLVELERQALSLVLVLLSQDSLLLLGDGDHAVGVGACLLARLGELVHDHECRQRKALADGLALFLYLNES